MIPSSSGQSTYWVGANYNIWRAYADANPYVYTWVYNDTEGNIIFEVTKFYKWSMKKREPEDLDFVTYKKFMKDYKPLIHRVIPRDIAIAWLKKAKKWYQVIYKNEIDVINA